MIRVNSLVRVVGLGKEARVSAIRVDDNGQALVDVDVDGVGDWVARPWELVVLEY